VLQIVCASKASPWPYAKEPKTEPEAVSILQNDEHAYDKLRLLHWFSDKAGTSSSDDCSSASSISAFTSLAMKYSAVAVS
jgi:hypothetical protein